MIWALVTGASELAEFATLAAKDGFDVILTARQADKLEVHAAVCAGLQSLFWSFRRI